MLFANKIRQLWDEKQILQRRFVAVKDIDMPLFSEIERGERRAKREQVIAVAKIFKVNSNDFLSLWLADRIIEVIKNEKELAGKALIVTQKYLKK